MDEGANEKLDPAPDPTVTAGNHGRPHGDQATDGRTAADLFRDIEPLDDTSAAEMLRAVREAREATNWRQG